MEDQNDPVLSPEERVDTVNEELKLIQRKAGLTYGTDAFLLASYITPMPRERAVELGGGTGVVSLLLARKRKCAQIFCVEVQPTFADLIARNAALNGLTERVKPICKDVRSLTAGDVGGEVRLVFSNPPYMKTDSGKSNSADEKNLARHEVCGDIGDFCASAARLLRDGGRFVTVYRPDRLADLFSALRQFKLEPKRLTPVYADRRSEPCMVLCESVKCGGVSLTLTQPLFLYEDDSVGSPRKRTARAEEIYQTCSFPALQNKKK